MNINLEKNQKKFNAEDYYNNFMKKYKECLKYLRLILSIFSKHIL